MYSHPPCFTEQRRRLVACRVPVAIMPGEAPQDRCGLFRRRDAYDSVSAKEPVDKSSSNDKEPSIDMSFATAEGMDKFVFEGVIDQKDQSVAVSSTAAWVNDASQLCEIRCHTTSGPEG